MLNATKTTQCLLIGAAVEESDVLFASDFHFRKEDGVGMHFGIVIILAIAGQSAEVYAFILLVPVVDREEGVTLVDGPGIGKSRHEGTVDHVP